MNKPKLIKFLDMDLSIEKLELLKEVIDYTIKIKHLEFEKALRDNDVRKDNIRISLSNKLHRRIVRRSIHRIRLLNKIFK